MVLPTPIPDKGRVLTGLSRFWFARTAAAGIVANHLLGTDPATLPAALGDRHGRGAARPDHDLPPRRRPLPVELIVRGYLSGSGWKDYRATGDAVRHPRCRPACARATGCRRRSSRPSTKAEQGHDENIDFDAMVALVGAPVAERARDIALALYAFGAAHAETAGILLADTKFELGILPRARRGPRRPTAAPRA